MIVPKWYRSKHSFKAVQLTEDNIKEVKGWIRTESYFGVTNCNDKKHVCVFNPKKELEGGRVIDVGEYVIIDDTGQIIYYSSEDFEKMFYEVGFRTTETEDILGD